MSINFPLYWRSLPDMGSVQAVSPLIPRAKVIPIEPRNGVGNGHAHNEYTYCREKVYLSFHDTRTFYFANDVRR